MSDDDLVRVDVEREVVEHDVVAERLADAAHRSSGLVGGAARVQSGLIAAPLPAAPAVQPEPSRQRVREPGQRDGEQPRTARPATTYGVKLA